MAAGKQVHHDGVDETFESDDYLAKPTLRLPRGAGVLAGRGWA